MHDPHGRNASSSVSRHAQGALFALAAAILNATIGILSKLSMAGGFPPTSIAFLKTTIGFSVLLLMARGRIESAAVYFRSGLCAFFGIFMLFLFETLAYEHELAANVVLTLMASGAVSAFVLSRIVIGEKSHPMKWFGLLVCIAGLSVFLGAARPSSLLGLAYAAIAGISYGAFSVMAKAMNLGGGLAVTRRLLMFGGVYLSLPFGIGGSVVPAGSIGLWGCIVALAVLPSIGGFYCTTRAIELSTPSQIQLFELTEPVFAAVFALVLLNEQPGLHTFIGGALVIAGLCLSQHVVKK